MIDLRVAYLGREVVDQLLVLFAQRFIDEAETLYPVGIGRRPVGLRQIRYFAPEETVGKFDLGNMVQLVLQMQRNVNFDVITGEVIRGDIGAEVFGGHRPGDKRNVIMFGIKRLGFKTFAEARFDIELFHMFVFRLEYDQSRTALGDLIRVAHDADFRTACVDGERDRFDGKVAGEKIPAAGVARFDLERHCLRLEADDVGGDFQFESFGRFRHAKGLFGKYPRVIAAAQDDLVRGDAALVRDGDFERSAAVPVAAVLNTDLRHFPFEYISRIQVNAAGDQPDQYA